MVKPKNKPAPTERISVARPLDPNRCFVHFSRVSLTTRTALVGLTSLIRQIEKQPIDRTIQAIHFDPEALIMEVIFVTAEGVETLAESERGT